MRIFLLIAFFANAALLFGAKAQRKFYTVQKGKYKGLKVCASSAMKAQSPDQAFDGDPNTAWVPSRRNPSWITIDLGSPQRIKGIIWNGDKGSAYRSRIPETYRFTASESGDFSGEQKLLTGAEGNRQNTMKSHYFPQARARFVRMEIFNTHPNASWQPLVDEINIITSSDSEFQVKKIQVECKSPWRLFGIIEELRANGYTIPERLEEIENEACSKLNVERYFKEGIFKKRLEEALKIMNAMEWIPGTPCEYKKEKVKTVRNKDFPVWETKEYLKDNVLTVGLKSYPCLIDFNNDGKKDLLLGDHDGFVYIFINYGSNKKPVYRKEKRLKSSSTGKDIAVRFNPKLNFADMNGDGKLDIILGSYDGIPYMLLNESKDEKGFLYDDHKYTKFETENGPLDVGNYVYPFVVDWNKDGLMDIVTGEIEGNVHLHLNKGSKEKPFFKAPVKIASISPDMYPDPFLIDLNGDGKRDLILGARSGKIYYYQNKGSDEAPVFKGFTLLKPNGKNSPGGRLSHIHFADWNADGTVDLLLGNDHGEVRVFPGRIKDGKISFNNEILLRTEEKVELVSKVHPVITLGDWNGDGKTDIIAGGEGPELRLFLNKGAKEKAEFVDYSIIPNVEMKADAFLQASEEEKKLWDNPGLEFITEYLGNAAPELVDWDKDGKLDLLVGNYAGLVYFYKNIGTKQKPELAKPVPLKAGGKLLNPGGYSTPRAVDWNGDGKLDLITGNLYGKTMVYINSGTAQEASLSKGKAIKVDNKDLVLGPRSIVEFADLDGDGLKDLIIGNRTGKVYALKNTGSNKEPKFSACEMLQDKSKVWEELYGGGWLGPRGHFPLKWKMGKEVSDMGLEATSCPRFVDFNNDGKKELIISHRFGRIFVFTKQ
jgi:hypothetical protein